MLIHSLLRLVNRRIRITAVVLSRRILARSHRMIIIAAVLTRRCQMRIRCIVVHRPVAAVRQRIVAVRRLSVDEVVAAGTTIAVYATGHVRRISGRRGHLHLPERVL